jgi:hypothetical protein
MTTFLRLLFGWLNRVGEFFKLISLFNDHLSALAFRLAKPGR